MIDKITAFCLFFIIAIIIMALSLIIFRSNNIVVTLLPVVISFILMSLISIYTSFDIRDWIINIIANHFHPIIKIIIIIIVSLMLIMSFIVGILIFLDIYQKNKNNNK